MGITFDPINFKIISIHTPRSAFTMEYYRMDVSADYVRLAVASHQDVSLPLSELVSRTNRVYVRPQELQPFLSQVFDFKEIINSPPASITYLFNS